MHPKTLFRVLLKFLGVWLLLQAAFTLVTGLSYFLQPGFTLDAMWLLRVFGGMVLQVAAGLYLLVGGTWLVNVAFPRAGHRCPHCSYDLTGLAASADRCPECGGPGVAAAGEA